MMNNNADALQARLNQLAEEISGKKKEPTLDEIKRAEAYAHDFWDTMRTGMPNASMNIGSKGSGAFTVPDTFSDTLVQKLAEENILRKISRVITSNSKKTIPLVLSNGSASWVDETDSYADGEVEFGQAQIDLHKLGTIIRLSDEMLEDSGFDLEKYIGDVFAERIGAAEEQAFFTGDGIAKPIGLIHQAPVGVVTEEAGKISLDDIIELIHSVGQQYRSHEKSVLVMSNGAYQQLRMIQNLEGKRIWMKNLRDGEPYTLFGYRVFVSNCLPDPEPGNITAFFGDFNWFWIAERGKRIIKRLEERFAESGQVAFITSERVDGVLVLPDAVKSLKIAE